MECLSELYLWLLLLTRKDTYGRLCEVIIQAAGIIVAPFIPVKYWAFQLLIYGLFGVMNTIINISLFSILQRKIEPAYIGKMFAFINMAASGMQPLGSGLTGFLGDRLPIQVIFVGAALMGIAANIRFAMVPGLRGYLLPAKPNDPLDNTKHQAEVMVE